ncbi:MAG: 16S rRNA (guanine(966)-N(2))-methyltransferase RsmD [Gammaproteobacteria bacterium]|nr:16S rRNA (guanine(966)-N(2))-methyltransferase RsmD [Gammaproteobacteria bacterium]
MPSRGGCRWTAWSRSSSVVPKRTKAEAPRGAAGSVRIIGGRWRGTRIEVAARPDLRPSGDRVRETLFNWLAPWIEGARCLDLYAGTGVLGLEAVSRGAASAVLVERDAVLVERLAALRTRLDAGAAVTVVRDDAEHWLTSPARPFDVVFLDPPFAAGVTAALLERLAQGWLAPRALVYLEQAIDAPDPPSPWCVRKAGHTRHVSYKLLDRSG